jgi:peptidoglycan/xylan/chitin deacetylase (PgdA/CDA1 family)
MRFKPSKYLRKLMPALIWDVPGAGDGDVFLTFDDGPTPGITEWILKELARFDMKATFFCLGKNVALYPELYEQILAAGHRVGNHTYNHSKGWGVSTERYIKSVGRAEKFIHSDLFRPPYGRISPRKSRLLSARYKIVMWNIISRDYNRQLSRRGCLNNVIQHVHAGDIIVFHDSEKAFKNLLFALPRTLRWLSDNGLKSKAIEI